jgi:8-hydroxy-5-deazaflavin:NADPH oxidoreductase
MRIGIVGAGVVGTSLGKALMTAGHAVMFSSRDPSSAKMQTLAAETGAAVGTVAETVAFGEVVAIAMSWDAIPDAVREGGDWSGKIIIDANNRFGPSASGKSAAEDLADLTGGRVVKAFNTIGAEHYTHPRLGGEAASMLVAGDDAEAKAVVVQLAAAMGFEPVDAGDLAAARHLENLAALWVHLAYGTPNGRNIAFRLLRG